jgi:hypothetical protein
MEATRFLRPSNFVILWGFQVPPASAYTSRSTPDFALQGTVEAIPAFDLLLRPAFSVRHNFLTVEALA